MLASAKRRAHQIKRHTLAAADHLDNDIQLVNRRHISGIFDPDHRRGIKPAIRRAVPGGDRDKLQCAPRRRAKRRTARRQLPCHFTANNTKTGNADFQHRFLLIHGDFPARVSNRGSG